MAEMDREALVTLGEIKGQLRELIHNTNNLMQTVTALALRVATLEADFQRRQGANSIILAIAKSPAVGWLVGIAVSAWAVITGKVHP